MLLFPAYFLRFLWELPSRVVFHEPKGYRSPRRRRKNQDGAVANAVRSGERAFGLSKSRTSTLHACFPEVSEQCRMGLATLCVTQHIVHERDHPPYPSLDVSSASTMSLLIYSAAKARKATCTSLMLSGSVSPTAYSLIMHTPL